MTDQDLTLIVRLLAHLKADKGLQALLGDPARIWDRVMPGAGVPYLTLQASRSRGLPGAEGAFEHEVDLICTSRFRGSEEARAVMAALRLALDGVALSDPALKVLRLEVGPSHLAVSSDGQVTTGRLNLRAVTEG
jgi:hypothetical protein